MFQSFAPSLIRQVICTTNQSWKIPAGVSTRPMLSLVQYGKGHCHTNCQLLRKSEPRELLNRHRVPTVWKRHINSAKRIPTGLNVIYRSSVIATTRSGTVLFRSFHTSRSKHAISLRIWAVLLKPLAKFTTALTGR